MRGTALDRKQVSFERISRTRTPLAEISAGRGFSWRHDGHTRAIVGIS
jgi:hypothetical protein